MGRSKMFGGTIKGLLCTIMCNKIGRGKLPARPKVRIGLVKGVAKFHRDCGQAEIVVVSREF